MTTERSTAGRFNRACGFRSGLRGTYVFVAAVAADDVDTAPNLDRHHNAAFGLE